jgi:hypothetical protein
MLVSKKRTASNNGYTQSEKTIYIISIFISVSLFF